MKYSVLPLISLTIVKRYFKVSGGGGDDDDLEEESYLNLRTMNLLEQEMNMKICL
jgi:hypothetical protein